MFNVPDYMLPEKVAPGYIRYGVHGACATGIAELRSRTCQDRAGIGPVTVKNG